MLQMPLGDGIQMLAHTPDGRPGVDRTERILRGDGVFAGSRALVEVRQLIA